MASNFKTNLSYFFVTKFWAKTHLFRYQIIPCFTFLNVLTNSVLLILSVVTLAVLSLILSVSINVQTVLYVIIISVFVLNCYDGYTTLIHHSIYFGKILSETGLSHVRHHISKHKVNCYQEAGDVCSYFILIWYSSFSPGISSSPWIFALSNSSPSMHGLCWRYRNIWRDLIYRDWYLLIVDIHLYL